MYSSLLNQLYHLLHFGFSFFVIGILAPYFVFHQTFTNKGNQLLSNYIRIVFVIILLGYLLVITKLFEVLTLLFLYLLVIVLLYAQLRKKRQREKSISQILLRFFDTIDGLIYFDRKDSKKKMMNLPKVILEKFNKLHRSRDSLWKGAVIIFVFGYSLYIRFYDAVTHAAPPLSDSYVTLAWMKYISSRILFHDGIYPQGFHIYLATLQKFAAIDPIFVLKYTGPLQSFFIVILMYFFVIRLTGNFLAAIVTASIYGLAGPFILYNSMERQVATNSQEFAFVFIFPALYFLMEYFWTKEKSNLLTGIFATSIVGLAHSFAFAYLGLAIGLLMITHLIVNGKKVWMPVLTVAFSSIGAVFIALIPFGIGKLLGKQVHISSADYLTSTIQNQITSPFLHAMDYTALLGLLVLFIYLFNKKNDSKERVVVLFTFLLGLGIFLLFFLGGPLTKSVLISSRALDLWALTIPIILGITTYIVMRKTRQTIQWTLIVLSLLVVAVGLRPSPIEAYKLERDSYIEQFLLIQEEHTPKSWMIVSQDEGYSMVLGSGIHMYMKNFLEWYDPNKPPLTRIDTGDIDYHIPPDVYVFHEKKVFKVSEDNSIYTLLKPKYDQREQDNKNFIAWLNTYQKHGNKVSLFYEDENFAVYHFHIPSIKKKERKRFWEDGI